MRTQCSEHSDVFSDRFFHIFHIPPIWALDSEPGKWENMMMFLQKSYVFGVFWRVIIHFLAKSDRFFQKKSLCGHALPQQVGCRYQNDLKPSRIFWKTCWKIKNGLNGSFRGSKKTTFFLPEQIDDSGFNHVHAVSQNMDIWSKIRVFSFQKNPDFLYQVRYRAPS